MDLPALGEENLAKDSEENDKNWMILLCRVGEREREKLKKLLKKCFEWVKHRILKKPDSQYSIDRKTISINRNRQRHIEIFNRNFD